jgi:hypothetical protein
VGSIPIGRAIFDGPLCLGYRQSPDLSGRARSNRAPSGNPWIPISPLVRRSFLGWAVVKFGIENYEWRILDSELCTLHFADGSQDWVIAHNDVVAGSSPASGTKCRSSSVVEHVIPSSFLIRRFFQRAVDCGLSELLVGGSNPPFRFGGSSSIR